MRGITFIELVIVVIIIAILAAVSIPQLKKTFDNYELESFVKDIYYLAHYLQASAISQAKVHCLNINQEKNPLEFFATYQIESDQEEKIYRAVEGRFGRLYPAPEGVTVSSAKTALYFYPDGSIDEGRVVFKNRYDREISLVIQGARGVIKIK